MRKRILDLLSQKPLLNVASYGRAGPQSLTQTERELIGLTVRRTPEVMVKVSGGARSLAGVERHLAYIGRNGKLPVESDTGERLGNKGFEAGLVLDWNLDLEVHQRQNARAVRTARRPPKLVHNVIFSMPSGTPPDKVLKAVRQLAREEFGFRHRHAMVLHTDEPHPYVHLVIKAMSEQGERLNIWKATLRKWRQQVASNLRELGVAANATERAVRGQSRTGKSDGIYRAAQRGESSHMRERALRTLRRERRRQSKGKLRYLRRERVWSPAGGA